MAPGLLVEVLDDLLEPPGSKPEELPLLAADDRDDRPVTAGDERDEGSKVEVPSHFHDIRDGLEERQRRPEIVEAGCVDREPLGAVPFELVVEPASNSLQIGLERQPLLMSELLAAVLF